jgi:hypothetical protein
MTSRNGNARTGDAGAPERLHTNSNAPANTPNCQTLQDGLADLAARIRAEHKACAVAIKRGCEHAINAGKLLIEAKDLLGHGQWLPWLAEHCVLPERTAQLYMRLAHHAPEFEAKSATVADLTVRGAIKLLAPPVVGTSKATYAAEEQQQDDGCANADFAKRGPDDPIPAREIGEQGEPAQVARIALAWLILADARDPQLAEHLAAAIETLPDPRLTLHAVECVIAVLAKVAATIRTKQVAAPSALEAPRLAGNDPGPMPKFLDRTGSGGAS